MSGTSMAAPYVAGVAALIKSIRPNLSALEIKELILDNVDKLTSLQDKCITGGRLNAYKAVLAATEPETFTGDVNGDGKDDFIVHYRNLNGNRSALVYKGKSGAPYLDDATTDALTSTNEYRPQDPVFVGDFNGDGYACSLGE